MDDISWMSYSCEMIIVGSCQLSANNHVGGVVVATMWVRYFLFAAENCSCSKYRYVSFSLSPMIGRIRSSNHNSDTIEYGQKRVIEDIEVY